MWAVKAIGTVLVGVVIGVALTIGAAFYGLARAVEATGEGQR